MIELLGVSKNSTSGEIKKAYFQLAKKWHPDVNKSPEAKEKFSKINMYLILSLSLYRVCRAYETLSDENKRKMYDSYGMTGDEQAQYGQAGGIHPKIVFYIFISFLADPFSGFGDFAKGGFWGNSDFGGQGAGFEDLFSEFENFFSGGKSKQQQPTKKGRDITVSMHFIYFLNLLF